MVKKKKKKKHNKKKKKQLKKIYKNKLHTLYYTSRESFLITKLFISFLKSHNALDQYISNLKKGKQGNYKRDENLFDLDKLIITNYYIQKNRNSYDMSNCTRLISNAFIWDWAKEGLDYWNDLNKKWLHILYSLPYSKLSLFPYF